MAYKIKKVNIDPLKSSMVKAMGVLAISRKAPDELLGELFGDVQTQQIYPDGKTFVDLIPKRRVRSIKEEYKLLKSDPNFDLREFVARHFTDLSGAFRDIARTPMAFTMDDLRGSMLTFFIL